jgi:hypothetical protein
MSNQQDKCSRFLRAGGNLVPGTRERRSEAPSHPVLVTRLLD